MQSFMDYNIGIWEFPHIFCFFYENMQKKGVSEPLFLFPDNAGQIKTSQIHPFFSCKLCRRMNLFHLLLLLFDHLSDHLSTDGTSLAGRKVTVVAVL